MIWAFQVSGPLQLIRVSLTIVYTCRDHVLESLIQSYLTPNNYPKMTPKFVKQKSHRLQSSIKFANPVQSLKVIHRSEQRYCSIILQRFVWAHYLPTNPLTLQTSVIYFFCSLKHEKEGECGDLPAMGIPTEPKDELSIIYSYSVTFMVSSPALLFFLLSLSLEEQN